MGAGEPGAPAQQAAALGGCSCARMSCRVSYAKRFWQKRTNGNNTTAAGCAGRLTAHTSYLHAPHSGLPSVLSRCAQGEA